MKIKCPNCGSTGSIHSLASGNYGQGEYACEICLHEFYGRTMIEAIRNVRVSTEKPENKK